MGQEQSVDASTSFTESLRLAAGEQWDRVIKHKFTTELASGEIDREVLKRYLIQDHRFLDAFVILLASMIAHCRTLEDRIPGCQFIAVITGAENTYFERAFVQLGCSDAEQRNAIPNAGATDGFINLMKGAASSGSLGEMLAVLVVCEWSYGTWGELVLAETKREDFVCYEWVDLHSGEDFRSLVAYLRGLLDKEAGFLKDEEKEIVKAKFLEAVSLEEQFFDDAYNAA
mmetsp:Transcript_30137/g.44289  ORF Transcript_30137/g.44289 Transcript_30137/m.44289 type:complete len:229 (-) Transcript_30137:160-846(-)